MNMVQANLDLLHQLEQTLRTTHIPNEEKRRAAQLLSRLKSPVQIVVIGRKGAGKSRLVNMLLSDEAQPETADLPPLEYSFGSQAKTVFLQTDGSEKTVDGVHLSRPAPPGTTLVRVEMPLAILNRLSLTELTLSGDPEEQRIIADWAVNRADIVLWCSQTFDETERMLWSSASETLKDHSFLVLTKADQLQMQGILSERIEQLEDVVAEEFYRMYPVATIQAISSRGTDGTRDEDAWTSSGGRALSEAVLQLVETGRRADKDNALMFLQRYATAREVPDSQPAPAPRKEAEEPQQAVEADTTEERPDTARKVIDQALDFLQERADLMLGVAAGNRPDKQVAILDHCLETADKLSEFITEVDQTNPSLSGLQEDIMECGDMMVLFHLEKTEDAAADAVTLLLQLRKEMSVAGAS